MYVYKIGIFIKLYVIETLRTIEGMTSRNYANTIKY